MMGNHAPVFADKGLKIHTDRQERRLQGGKCKSHLHSTLQNKGVNLCDSESRQVVQHPRARNRIGSVILMLS